MKMSRWAATSLNTDEVSNFLLFRWPFVLARTVSYTHFHYRLAEKTLNISGRELIARGRSTETTSGETGEKTGRIHTKMSVDTWSFKPKSPVFSFWVVQLFLSSGLCCLILLLASLKPQCTYWLTQPLVLWRDFFCVMILTHLAGFKLC